MGAYVMLKNVENAENLFLRGIRDGEVQEVYAKLSAAVHHEGKAVCDLSGALPALRSLL